MVTLRSRRPPPAAPGLELRHRHDCPWSHSSAATATDIAGNTSAASAADAVTVAALTPPHAASTAPTLTVANNSLYVSLGGSIPLGLEVSVPHAGDNVTVNISGLPKYETITDKLDGKSFSGSSVTLTAARSTAVSR